MNAITAATLLAQLTIASASLSVLCLLALHFTSKQFHPGWRMISEYALGKHKWLLTLFFISWGASSFFLGALLWPEVRGTWPTIAVLLLFASGVGEIMGGLFDVKHKLHGASFALGIPTLPIAALILTYQMLPIAEVLGYKTLLLVTAHGTWISVIVMAVSMMILISGFKKAGFAVGPDATPPEKLPAGVIGISGYANRLLVLTYIGWLVVVACMALKAISSTEILD